MWELDCEESWATKNWCFRTVVLEKTPLDCNEIQPIHPKGNQSWISTGRTDIEAETPILWPPDVKNWLIWKDPDAGKDWRQEEKGMTEDGMVWWHAQLNGHEFEWTPGVGDGQEGLACCSPCGRKESDMTEWLNWNELNWEKNNSFLSPLKIRNWQSTWPAGKQINYTFGASMVIQIFTHKFPSNATILWLCRVNSMKSFMSELADTSGVVQQILVTGDDDSCSHWLLIHSIDNRF